MGNCGGILTNILRAHRNIAAEAHHNCAEVGRGRAHENLDAIWDGPHAVDSIHNLRDLGTVGFALWLRQHQLE